MKLRTYNGLLKDRSSLEDILQEKLPQKAKVIFATKNTKTIPLEFGAPAMEDHCLAFWAFGRRFFGCHIMRRHIPDEVSGEMQTSDWMAPQLTQIDPKSALAGLQDARMKWPDAWVNLKDAITEVFAKMVEMEKEWGIEPVEAEAVLASEKFKSAARRN